MVIQLLRSSNTLAQLPDGTADDIHSLISKTADAYYDASVLSPAATSAAYHARFLRSLVKNDIFKIQSRRNDRETSDVIDPRLQGMSCHSRRSMYSIGFRGTRITWKTLLGPMNPRPSMYDNGKSANSSSNSGATTNNSTPTYGPVATQHGPYQFPIHTSHKQQSHEYGGEMPIRPATINMPVNYPGFAPAAPQHASELDAHYWKNMFIELGFGDAMEGHPAAPQPAQHIMGDERAGNGYTDGSHHHHQHQVSHSNPQHTTHIHHQPTHHQNHHHQGHIASYHSAHTASPSHYVHQS